VHDLVISNARLIDGLGAPARDGSLAVTEGRIAAIGDDRRGRELGAAREQVDAQGLVLAPRIVDLHTHYDAQLTWDLYATPSTGLGVTTVVIGNCGFTIAPCRPVHRDLVVRKLTHVEGALKEEIARPGVPNRFSDKNWDHLTIAEVSRPEHRRLEGTTIGALARERGQHPWDTFLDFGLDGELDAMLDCRLFNIDEDEVRRLLRHPNAAVALSDAGAHLSFLCDAGFGLHLFGHWARERGDLTLEQAVRAVTSTVADASTASATAAACSREPGSI
jgi:N-acyl-D-aspartate/D-glutamate deacylase